MTQAALLEIAARLAALREQRRAAFVALVNKLKQEGEK